MTQLTREQQAAALEKDWAENPRWKGIKRGYTAADGVAKVYEGSGHNERDWAARLDEPLQFLLAPRR